MMACAFLAAYLLYLFFLLFYMFHLLLGKYSVSLSASYEVVCGIQLKPVKY